MIRVNRLLMAAALAVGLAASTTRAADPDKLLPAEADTVVSINLRQVLDSKIFEDYALKQVKQALEGQDLKKMLGDLGLDPLKDVDKVVIGAQVNSKNDTKYLMVVYGNFDPVKLFKTAEAATKTDADKFAMIKDGKTIMFKFQPENGDPPIYGTVVNEKMVIAASDKKLISNALAAHEAGKGAALKPELAALIKKMDEKASLFVVGIVKGKFDDVNIPQNDFIDLTGINKAIPKIETIAVTAKVGKDVTLEVTLGMKDEDSASDLQTAVNKLLGDLKPLAALGGAGDLLASVKSSLKNKDVTISGKATGADIGKLIKAKD